MDQYEHLISLGLSEGFLLQYSSKGDKKPIYILVKICKEEDIDDWIAKVKDSVDRKTTQIGLKNPDALTLQRISTELKNIIEEKGLMTCRPKIQSDFRKIVKSTFDMIKQNSLSLKDKECKERLKIENIARCLSPLQRFLIFSREPDEIIMGEKKAAQCLQGILRRCCGPFLNNTISALRFALIIDAKIIKEKGTIFEYCNPDYDSEEASTELTETPDDYLICGPGGILVRVKRDLSAEEVPEWMNREVETSDSSVLPQFAELPEEINGNRRNIECTTSDYIYYFDHLRKCSERKLLYNVSSPLYNCSLNNMETSWLAIIECMVTNEKYKLDCVIKSDKQMTEYLNYVGLILNNNQEKFYSCSGTEWCYGRSTPSLYRCSTVYRKLLNSKFYSPNQLEQVLKKESDILECLNAVWPNCSLNTSLLSLPVIYIPLEAYNFSALKATELVACTLEDVDKHIQKYPQCLDIKYKVNKTDNHNLDACKLCIKEKQNICLFNKATQLYEFARKELSGIKNCLQNFMVNDECIYDVTVRMTDECLPMFYGCYKIAKNVFLSSKTLEYCWNFNNCILNISSACPTEFQYFVPNIYYRILGLNIIF